MPFIMGKYEYNHWIQLDINNMYMINKEKGVLDLRLLKQMLGNGRKLFVPSWWKEGGKVSSAAVWMKNMIFIGEFDVLF